MIHEPFFIIGNPRSGTSLFRLMLNSHEHLLVPPECGFLQWWHSKYQNWSADNSKSYDDISTYVNDLLTSKKIDDWNLEKKDLVDRIIKARPNTYGELSLIVYLSYNKSSKSILKIGDKNNYYIDHLATLDGIYPEAKYVHIVRDGRDVACSYLALNKLKSDSKYKPNLSSTIGAIASDWNSNLNRIITHLEHRDHLTIKYEDLIINTKHTLKQVSDFLQVDYSDQMLNYYKHDHNDEPKSTLDWKTKTLEPPDKTNLNKFHTLLTAEQIRVFNELNRDLLDKFNYE